MNSDIVGVFLAAVLLYIKSKTCLNVFITIFPIITIMQCIIFMSRNIVKVNPKNVTNLLTNLPNQGHMSKAHVNHKTSHMGHFFFF